MELTPEELETVNVSRLHDCHHSEWVDRCDRRSDSLRERLEHVRFSQAPRRHTSGAITGKTLQRKWVFLRVAGRKDAESCKELQNCTSRKIHLARSAEESAESIKELTPDEQETTLASRGRLQDLP